MLDVQLDTRRTPLNNVAVGRRTRQRARRVNRRSYVTTYVYFVKRGEKNSARTDRRTCTRGPRRACNTVCACVCEVSCPYPRARRPITTAVAAAPPGPPRSRPSNSRPRLVPPMDRAVRYRRCRDRACVWHVIRNCVYARLLLSGGGHRQDAR